MANHGYIKTRKFMSAERVSQLLDELILSHFKGQISYEYVSDDGSHTWAIKYVGPYEEGNYYRTGDSIRICWLNTRRSFEMRHGGGSDFSWWVDSVILNEVSLRFNGTISDDGVEGSWKGEPDYCKTYQEYVMKKVAGIQDEPLRLYLQSEQQFTPPDFRFELGPDFPGFSVRTIQHDGYTVIITSGGVSVKGKEGWDFSTQVNPPEDFNDNGILKQIAVQAVQEYQEFAGNAPALQAFDSNLRYKIDV